jgi:hypothetical protein
MPDTGLFGPFSLTTVGVNDHVKGLGAGAFALGDLNQNGGLTVKYVGRSDEDLSARLLQHVPKAYTHFKYGFYPSAKAAFEKECTLYHDFNPPDNLVHPARPRNSNWACPKGCAL